MPPARGQRQQLPVNVLFEILASWNKALCMYRESGNVRPGLDCPQAGHYRQVTIYLDADAERRLKAAARKAGVSVSHWVGETGAEPDA